MSLPVHTHEVSAPPCVTAAEDQTAWFKEQVHAHDDQLRAFLRGSFPKVRDVEDVVQESYLRVWRRQAVEPIRFAKAFLFTIAKRLAIDLLRREKNSLTDPVEDLETLAVYDHGSTVADAASRAEIIALLIEAVDALPPRCREVVILRKFQFLSSRATAEQLGVGEHTVEMQLMRGNARIRDYLATCGITSSLGRET